MPYPPFNPYVPGDPYSYDLKWLVDHIIRLERTVYALDDTNIGDYTTPEEYGAKGDGVTDDTEAFQKAINSGKSLVLLTKTYLVNNNKNAIPVTDGTDSSRGALIIDHPITIMGRPGSLIKGYNDNDASSDIKYVFCVQSEHVRISGITIDNQWTGLPDSGYHRGYGIQANASFLTVEGCSFYNHGSSALVINGLIGSRIHDISVSHLYCENMGNTIFACWADDLDFSDIYIKNASEGFDFDKQCKNVNINNITVDTKRGSGADAALEINSGINFNIANVNITNFVDGILVNGKKYNGVKYFSEDINIKNVNMDNIDGYGVVCGNAIAGEIEIFNLMLSNVFINDATYHAMHLRGENVIVNGAILTNCRYGAILIDTADKSNGITLANIHSQGNLKGFIECRADVKKLTLLNINDDESANTSTINLIDNQTELIINNMNVYGCADLATLNGRIYTIKATLAIIDNMITEMLGNAFIGFSDSTERVISNSRLAVSANQTLTNPSVYMIEGATPQTSRIWNAGDIVVGSTGDVFLCDTGNVGGGTAVFKQFTLV